MAQITIENLSVDFPIYGTNSRSLKKHILSQATGGRLMQSANDAVTVRAIDDMNLTIRHGERVGLIGHNGAGKSTLLRVIAGIYKPTAGSVRIEGKVSALLDPSAGIDPQSTGIENIYLRGYILGLSKAEISRHLDDIADFTGLGDFLHLPLRTYSAGMAARLGFAISTIVQPDILLIDEGIGAGDADFFAKVQRRVDEFIQRSSIMILSSHNESLIAALCDKVLRLQGGRIVQGPQP